jgi:hypothetical protein
MTSTVVGIAQLLAHAPSFDLLDRELIPGLFDTSGDLTRPGFVPPWENVNAFGLSWSFFTIPPEFGMTLGDPIVYEPRMLQVSTIHTDFSGHDLVSEVRDFYSEGVYWLFENAGPTRVHYELAPGLQVVFYWIIGS